MTAAYAAFANHGLVPDAALIRRVEDRDGRVLYQAHDGAPIARDQRHDGVPDVERCWPTSSTPARRSRARRLGFTLPAAGKTGTTNDFNDAWFIGFTPKLVTGVWVGFDQPRTILAQRLRCRRRGAALGDVHEGRRRASDKPEWLTPPAGITQRQSLPAFRPSWPTEGCDQADVIGTNGQRERAFDGLHRVLREGRGTGGSAICTRRTGS